jgi:hypothetical protein
MALVYEALGATESLDKAKWSVLSFRQAQSKDPDLLAASTQHGRRLHPQYTYRYEMIRHDGIQTPHPQADKFDRVLVPCLERVLLFADPTIVVKVAPNGGRAQLYEHHR